MAGWEDAEPQPEVDMALSRTRQKELKKLKRSADDLWGQQREALDQASLVLREARRQANALEYGAWHQSICAERRSATRP